MADAEQKRERRSISGPGAADFLGSPGGLDRPETDPSKGMGQLRNSDEGPLADPSELTPELQPDDEDPLAGAPPRDPKARKPDL